MLLTQLIEALITSLANNNNNNSNGRPNSNQQQNNTIINEDGTTTTTTTIQQEQPNPYEEDLIRMYADLREMDSKCRTIVAQLAVMKKSNRELDDELDRTRDQVTTLKRRVAHLEASGASVPIPQRNNTTSSSTGQDNNTSSSSNSSSDVQMHIPESLNQQDILLVAARQLLADVSIESEGGSGSADEQHAAAHYRELAANRLEELQATKQMLASTASLLLLSNEIGDNNNQNNTTSKNSSSNITMTKDMVTVQRELSDLKLSELRAQRMAAYAGKELASLIKKIEELEAQSVNVTKFLESETIKEKKTLEASVEQLRAELDEKTREIAKLTTHAAQQQDAAAILAVVSERNELLSKQLEHERVSSSTSGKNNSNNNNNTSDDNSSSSLVDVYVAEIESTHQTLAASQKAAMELLTRASEKDVKIQQLMEERIRLESELRSVREEKTAMILKNNKEMEVHSQYHAHRTRLEARLSEAIKGKERAEELAMAHQHAMEKAIAERDEMRLALERALENEFESKERLKPLEDELKIQCERLAEARYDLGRSQEKQKKMRDRLDKLQTVVEQLSLKRAREVAMGGNSSSSGGGGGGSGSSSTSMMDSIRYEAMESALRCPVYPNLWKDCVITKCSHMFSRQALMDNLAQRNRKCPTCKTMFSDKDIVNLFLYQQNEE
jgi:hypothetical protein